MAAHARLKPPIFGPDSRDADDESITITPDPCAAMRRAAAVAVTKCVHAASLTGVKKSSSDISTSGMFVQR
jgi:hypothetical protein